MDKELLAPDVIAGTEGRAYAKIEGQNELLFFIKTLEARTEKIKSEVRAVGKRWVGHKTTGLKGSGSMTMYYLTPLFRQLIVQYDRTGKDVYFDIVIENEDPSSEAGRQNVLLKNCNLDSSVMGKLDSDSEDPLEEDVDFTYEGAEILQAFKKI